MKEEHEELETFDAQKSSVTQYTLDPEVKAKLDSENNVDSYLIRRYIKTNTDKLMGNTVNIPAFFFGGLYYFYRKMYLYGIIISIIEIAIMFFPFYYIWLLLFRLVLLFATNKLYIGYVYNEVQIIKEDLKDKTREDMAKRCSSVGGANVGSIFVGIFLSSLLTIAIYYLFAHIGIKVPEYGNIGAVWQNASGIKEPSSYNGKLSCNYIILRDLDYKVPDGFKKKRNFLGVSAKLNNDEETCSLLLRSVSMYKDPDTLAKQMSSYYGVNPTEEIINGNTWKTFSLNNKKSSTKYYIGGFENDVFIYTYEYTSESCIGKDKTFLESLELD